MTSTITLGHYNEHAERFWQGTRDHDVSQNRDALLQSLDGPGPFRILDFGCGPGRDLKTFRDLGHEAIGLDGAERFVELACEYSGCAVWCQDFLKLDLPQEYFDGGVCQRSRFMCEPRAAARTARALDGVENGGCSSAQSSRWKTRKDGNGERYGCKRLARWRELVTAAGIT